jgi:O-antigen ligase
MASLPSVALAALVLYAMAQTAPLPRDWLRWLAPSSYSLRESLLPRASDRVAGDPKPLVDLPPLTVSRNPDATLDTAARLAAYWLLFQAVLGLGDSAFRRFGLTIAVNATLIAQFSLIQALTWNGKIYWVLPTPSGNAGPFVNHNHLAAYLNIGLGFALGFLLSSDSHANRSWLHGSRPWAIYSACIIVVGVITSLSRSGFLAMIAAMMILLVIMRGRRLRLLSGLAAVAVLLALFLFALGDFSPYLQRLNTILNPDRSLYGRGEIWWAALRTWWSAPIWGTGLGSFAEATAPYFRHEWGAFAARAENEYLDLLVEGGVVGIGLALTALVSIARSGWRALIAAPSPCQRALVRGALFSLVTLGVHSLGDFALHIPGVAITAVILSAHLCRLGLQDHDERHRVRPTFLRRSGSGLVGLAMAVLSLVLVVHRSTSAHVEAVLGAAGLPFPGTTMPTEGHKLPRDVDLEQQRIALEHVLRHRPDWTEAHLRLGMTYLYLYQWAAADLIGDEVKDPIEKAILTDPLWMLSVVHSRETGQSHTAEELLEHEPIRLYLVPAAREFLEARRCCPVTALAHAKLASLHYLLERGDPASTYAERAVQLAGSDDRVTTYTGRVAVAVGDVDLAVRCWRRSLEVHPEGWEQVADAAGVGLSPDVILDRIIPSGRFALFFANRLYADPEDRAVRDRFLKAAIERLPKDRDLIEAERLHLEAQAWAKLDTPDRARERMEAALALEPQRDEWRKEFVDWLLGWGNLKEAHDQAIIRLHLAPNNPDAHRVLKLTVEALIRRTTVTHHGGTSP